MNGVAGLASAAIVAVPLAAQTPDRFALARLEADIVREHNVVRTSPETYVRLLRARLTQFEGRLLKLHRLTAIETVEGPAAVEEAVRVLERQPPLDPMFLADGMSQGARDHVLDHGPTGSRGHRGSDGSQPWDRIARYGSWSGSAAENIAYGPVSGREVVLQLLIDDGVPDRGHRRNILDTNFGAIGVACGPHLQFDVMCVITYANEYRVRPDPPAPRP